MLRTNHPSPFGTSPCSVFSSFDSGTNERRSCRSRCVLRCHQRPALEIPFVIVGRMKVGIVVPYSWSFWGAVVEHAELQAEALRGLGFDVRTIMGNDPPGSFTRVLHPRLGRHGEPPPDVIPIGRSVIVPANGSLPNIILSPPSFFRVRRALEGERFDVVHVHEPMTPIPAMAALSLART